MTRFALVLGGLATLAAITGCRGEPMPSISGYTSPSHVEAEQFAAECVALVKGGNALKIMDRYDGLYGLHTDSFRPGGKPGAELSAAEYEEFNALWRENWRVQLRMLSEAKTCAVTQIEERNGGQCIRLESTGKLAGTAVPLQIVLDVVKKEDGEIVIYQVDVGPGKR